MTKFRFSTRSINNLKGIHPDLVRVVHRALEISSVDFIVIEGLRTPERQRELVQQGKSKTMNSYHLTGHAVDIIPVGCKWTRAEFVPVVQAMETAAKELNVKLECGHWWKSFPDSPHYQFPR